MSEINYIEELPEGTFPINLKFIQKYQTSEPSIRAKYKDGTYHKDFLRGVITIDFLLILCNDKIIIMSQPQNYVLNWHHMYLLHTVMDKTEVTITSHLYWTEIRDAVRKEVTNFDTCQHTKL